MPTSIAPFACMKLTGTYSSYATSLYGPSWQIAMSYFFAKCTARSKKSMIGDGAGRVVRVVEPEHLRAVRDVGRDGVEVGQEAALLGQRQLVRLAAGEHRADLVDRVRGVRHERDVARIDEAERDVADALLRADERQHFLRRIEVNAEAAFVPARDGLAELGQALGLGIAVVRRLARGLAQRVDDVRRRRQVGVADAEGDDVDALCLLRRDLLADLREEIRRQLLDTVGEFHADPRWLIVDTAV